MPPAGNNARLLPSAIWPHPPLYRPRLNETCESLQDYVWTDMSPVDVELSVVGQVVVYDQRNLRNIQTSSPHVRRDQNPTGNTESTVVRILQQQRLVGPGLVLAQRLAWPGFGSDPGLIWFWFSVWPGLILAQSLVWFWLRSWPGLALAQGLVWFWHGSPGSRSELLHDGLPLFLRHVSMHGRDREVGLSHLLRQPVHLKHTRRL